MRRLSSFEVGVEVVIRNFSKVYSIWSLSAATNTLSLAPNSNLPKSHTRCLFNLCNTYLTDLCLDEESGKYWMSLFISSQSSLNYLNSLGHFDHPEPRRSRMNLLVG